MDKGSPIVMHIKGGSQYAKFSRTVRSVSKSGMVSVAGLGLNTDKVQMRFRATPDEEGRMGYTVSGDGIATWFTEE